MCHAPFDAVFCSSGAFLCEDINGIINNHEGLMLSGRPKLMEPLKIEGTEETPFVHIDKENNIFEISGNSYPEDATAFYKPVIQWIIDYSNSPNEHTNITFNFIYFNSASYKSIYDIIHLLDDIRQKKGVELKINWLYKEGDVDIKEVGEGLAETIKVPFMISPVNT